MKHQKGIGLIEVMVSLLLLAVRLFWDFRQCSLMRSKPPMRVLFVAVR